MRLKALVLSITALAFVGLLAAACGGDSDAAQAPNGSGSELAIAPGSISLQAASSGWAEGISVSGTGSVTADADTALLSMGVSVQADTAREARDRAATAMSDLLDSVRGNGVDADDIKTTQFSISPRFDYSRSGEPRIIGYWVNNSVSVKVRDLDSLSAVIDDAVEAVGDPIRINRISFTVDDRAAFISEARAGAMAAAQSKAQELATLGGVTLGKPIAISESSGGGVPPVFFGAARAEDAGVATPIEPGQLEITVSVHVVYAIE
ncbi:MAG: SIMPL domain-containing protein [Dehalococcoidia bacterium]